MAPVQAEPVAAPIPTIPVGESDEERQKREGKKTFGTVNFHYFIKKVEKVSILQIINFL